MENEQQKKELRNKTKNRYHVFWVCVVSDAPKARITHRTAREEAKAMFFFMHSSLVAQILRIRRHIFAWSGLAL